MDRRKFFESAVLGVSASVLLPATALASKEICDTPIIGAGGLFYTKDAPGRWSEKVAGHLPNIELLTGGEGVAVKVVTSHPMDGYNHYIVKHMLLNQDLEFIAEHMFDPTKDAVPMSEFSLGNYTGRLHVVSMCNKHDLWLNHIDIYEC
jgi:superoxide reductase